MELTYTTSNLKTAAACSFETSAIAHFHRIQITKSMIKKSKYVMKGKRIFFPLILVACKAQVE
jgi:hypothetical protein